MARQIIDLRTPAQKRGETGLQQSAQVFADLFDTIGQAEQNRQERQSLERITKAISESATIEEITAAASQVPGFSPGITGGLQRFASAFQPSPGGVGRGVQSSVLNAKLQQAFRDPLETEHKEAQIEATKSLTASRKETAKHELPDRMLRQADRYLRVVDDIMSEYWYTPEGPYRDQLLKDVQSNRAKALDLIEKYAPNSEAANDATERLIEIDEEIRKTKPKKIGIELGEVIPDASKKTEDFVVDRYPPPKDKATFDNILSKITSEKEKDRWFELHFKKEWEPQR